MSEKATALIQYEASLLRNIFHNTFMGIVETDLDFKIRLANRSACSLLKDGKDIVGLSIFDLLKDPDPLKEIVAKIKDETLTRHEGKWTPAETEFHTEFKMVVTLSRDNNYRVTGFLFMCEEVPFYTVCCVCHKVKIRNQWIPIEEMINNIASLSHTYCSDCMPHAIEKVRKESHGDSADR